MCIYNISVHNIQLGEIQHSKCIPFLCFPIFPVVISKLWQQTCRERKSVAVQQIPKQFCSYSIKFLGSLIHQIIFLSSYVKHKTDTGRNEMSMHHAFYDNMQIEVKPTPHFSIIHFLLSIPLSTIHHFSDYQKTFPIMARLLPVFQHSIEVLTFCKSNWYRVLNPNRKWFMHAW